jgi:hypothetical protein
MCTARYVNLEGNGEAACAKLVIARSEVRYWTDGRFQQEASDQARETDMFYRTGAYKPSSMKARRRLDGLQAIGGWPP